MNGTTTSSSETSSSETSSSETSTSTTVATRDVPDQGTITEHERETLLAICSYFATVEFAGCFGREWYIPSEGCPDAAAGYTVESLFAVLAACAATGSIDRLLEALHSNEALWGQCRQAAEQEGLWLPPKPPSVAVISGLAEYIAGNWDDVLVPLTRVLTRTAARHVDYLRYFCPPAEGHSSMISGSLPAAHVPTPVLTCHKATPTGQLGRLACITFAELNMNPARSTVLVGEPPPPLPDGPPFRGTADGSVSGLLRSLDLPTEHGRVVLMLGSPDILCWNRQDAYAFENQLAACEVDTVAVRHTKAGPDGPLNSDSWRRFDEDMLRPVSELSSNDASTVTNALEEAQGLWSNAPCAQLEQVTLSAQDDSIRVAEKLRRGYLTVLLHALSQNALTWARACRDGFWGVA